MYLKEIYIVILFFVLGLGRCLGQNGDSIHCDTGNLSIVLNCCPTLNGLQLEDGDEISVLSNITDIDSQRNSIVYTRDTLNTIPIAGTLVVDSSPATSKLEFSVESKSENCISGNVDFITDNTNSAECEIVILSLDAAYHIIEATAETICNGDEPVALHSDIPDNDYQITKTSPGLELNENREIVPRASTAGTHTIFLSSGYCLESDSLIVEIVAAQELNLDDTIPICEASGMSNTVPDIGEVQFYQTGFPEGYFGAELTESGDYIAYSFQEDCPSVDTVYVDIIRQPEIVIEEYADCDEVAVKAFVTGTDDYQLSWSNDVRGTDNVVNESTSLSVTVTDEFGCETSETRDITFNKLTLNSVDYRKEEADCWTDGNLTIYGEEVENYIGNYSYQLYNKLTNQVHPDLNDVPEGVYTLQVIDDSGCIAEHGEELQVIQKCLEDYPAFSPDGDNIEDSYFIPHEGIVSIYNREGQLIKEIETPAYWDGNDAQNHPLPMGNYLLITEEGRTVNITIIR